MQHLKVRRHSQNPKNAKAISPDAGPCWRVVSSKHCYGSTDLSFMRTLRLGLCVNDCDECGIALIKQFNSATKHKIQKQYPASVGKP